MNSLSDYFIPAPLSTLITLISGLSMAIVFDKIGKRIFRSNDPISRAMFFFVGLLVVAWSIWIICLLNFATLLIFHIILAFIFLFAVYSVYLNPAYYVVIMSYSYNQYVKPLFVDRNYFALAVAAVLLGYTLMSLAIPTDADSLNYHLALPVEILEKGSLWFNKDNLHFRMAGFGEMLNLLGVANGCSQLGAFVQMIAFLLTLHAVVETRKEGGSLLIVVMILCIPTLLFLVPNQKHQLTGILATFLCFYKISTASSLTRSELILWVSVLLFGVGIKYSFALSATVLTVFFLMKKWGEVNTIYRFLVVLVVFSFIVLGPQLIFKWYYWGDPLSPLFETLTANPDPIIVKLHRYIKNYYESRYPLPVSLIFTSSISLLSTIIGFSAVALFLIPLLFKIYSAEVVSILLLVLLILVTGQTTSRFFMEPALWSIPLFVSGFRQFKWFRSVVFLAKFQLVLILPFVFWGVYSLVPSIFSDQLRENVLRRSANGYAESKWLDTVLPADAKIAIGIRSRAFLPRPYLPWEYLFLTDLDNEKQASELDKMMKDYGINYLILESRGTGKLKERYAGNVVYGPKMFALATRKPFYHPEYEITVYQIKK